MVVKAKDTEIGGTFTVGEMLDKLDNPVIGQKRDNVVVKSLTVSDLAKALADPSAGLRDRKVGNTTLGAVLDELQKDEKISGKVLNDQVTLGQIIDFLKSNESIQAQRDKSFTVKMTVGEIFDLIGEENVKNFVLTKSTEVMAKPEYERSINNIVSNWLFLGLFILVFAILSTVSLELIDKDKR